MHKVLPGRLACMEIIFPLLSLEGGICRMLQYSLAFLIRLDDRLCLLLALSNLLFVCFKSSIGIYTILSGLFLRGDFWLKLLFEHETSQQLSCSALDLRKLETGFNLRRWAIENMQVEFIYKGLILDI